MFLDARCRVDPVKFFKLFVLYLIGYLHDWKSGGSMDDQGSPLPPTIPPEALKMVTPKPPATTRVVAAQPLCGSVRDRIRKVRG